MGDITYLRTSDGFEYLATVIDLFSRRVIGWSKGDEITADLACRALRIACDERQPAAGVIFHSDRGCQYTSEAFRGLCVRRGVQQSMSRTGGCYDNAVAESFFHSLKVEWLYGRDIREREAVRTRVFQYIAGYYNHHRRHSSIGYLTPAEFEDRVDENADTASRHDAPPQDAQRSEHRITGP